MSFVENNVDMVDIPPRPPYSGITQKQSYALVIRDMLFAHVVIQPFFEGFTARRSKQLPTQEYHLPYLGVYLVGEDMVEDGNCNHGEVRFINNIRIGFTVQMEDNDTLVLEQKLDEAYWAIVNGLWPDQYLMNMIDTWNPITQSRNPDNVRIEGIPRARRDINWGMHNETPFAELQFEPTIRIRTMFPPTIEDDLKLIRVRAIPKLGPGPPPDATLVQRIIMHYEFDPQKGALKPPLGR